MKKLLVLLFSIFFLSSTSVFAEDISDFAIEGISIGDSLLDYMTEDEILEEIEINKNDYYYLNEPTKYVEIYIFKDFPTYDFVSFFIKNNSSNNYLTNKNEKYIILSTRGFIDYIEDHNNCILKRDEIAETLSEMFPNAEKWDAIFPKSDDPSGKSTMDAVYFKLEEGNVQIACTNYEETFRIKKNYTEGLSVVVRPKEIESWMLDK